MENLKYAMSTSCHLYREIDEVASLPVLRSLTLKKVLNTKSQDHDCIILHTFTLSSLGSPSLATYCFKKCVLYSNNTEHDINRREEILSNVYPNPKLVGKGQQMQHYKINSSHMRAMSMSAIHNWRTT